MPRKQRTFHAWEFYLLSYTWGLLLNLIGFFVMLFCLLTGHRIRRFGWCIYCEIGKRWGGCEFGVFFVKDRESGRHVCEHEFGHAIQNCMFGPLMPFLICLPSSTRYWARRIGKRFGHPPRKPYDAIWFEGSASRLGARYASYLNPVSSKCADTETPNLDLRKKKHQL